MATEMGSKFIPVRKLRELLATLDGDLEVEVNQVGNLSLYAGAGKWRGYIDIRTETLHLEP